jgi:hypothetical protein
MYFHSLEIIKDTVKEYINSTRESRHEATPPPNQSTVPMVIFRA